MNKTLDRLISLILVATTTCAVAFSIEPVVEQPLRVEVGVKKELPKRHAPKKHTKAQHSKKSKVRTKCFGGSYFYAPAYQPTYYIKSIGADGGTIAMTDETVWSIAESSAYLASHWIENTPIVITPSKWYSKYDFYITNKLTGESVTAKLSQGPFVKHAVFIQQIDRYSGLVFLTNGTRWSVIPDQNFLYWQVGQAVLIGEDTTWSGRDYILVNINENGYVAASRLQ